MYKTKKKKKVFRLSLTENNRAVEDLKSRGVVLKLKFVHWVLENSFKFSAVKGLPKRGKKLIAF